MIEIDGTLRFHFSDNWRAAPWDGSAERAGLSSAGKCVDIVALGALALMVEVKDDRQKTPRSRRERELAEKSGEFAREMAQKAIDSIGDLRQVRSGPMTITRFASRWDRGPRQFVLWWELPPEPPSGVGTRSERWSARLSALQNTIRSNLKSAGLSVRVAVGNGRLNPDVVQGMRATDIASGLDARRRDVHARKSGTKSPR